MASGKRAERVGTRGGKRAHQKHRGPSQDPRRLEALAKAASEREALDRRMAAEEAEAQAQATARLDFLQKEAERLKSEESTRLLRLKIAQAARAEQRRKDWTLGQARSMVRQGYSVEHAVEFTGWPYKMLEDADRIFD